MKNFVDFIEHQACCAWCVFNKKYNLFPKQGCRADILMLAVRILCRDLASSGSKKKPCKPNFFFYVRGNQIQSFVTTEELFIQNLKTFLPWHQQKQQNFTQ